MKKTSARRKKIKKLDKEISALDSDIRSLSKSVGSRAGRSAKKRPGDAGQGTDLSVSYAAYWPETTAGLGAASPSRRRAGSGSRKMSARGRSTAARTKGKRRVDDKRFADYLASSFQSVRPLRHERRIQRNKAIVMAVFALLMLYWVLQVFFL